MNGARHLSPAPRRVPLALSIRVVVGGILGQIGWGVVAFGMIFVVAFDASTGIREVFRFAGDLSTAEGVSTGWRGTNLRINEVQVYETSYVFRSADGYDVEGVSYQTGAYLEEGLPVTVEYVGSDPNMSRIQGMRASQGGAWVALVYIFPLIGLVLAMAGLRKGLRARRLLATGELALATLRAKEPTSTVINNQPVYRYTFEFEVPEGGTYQVVGKTHKQSVLEDEVAERVVYDPRDPSEARLLDELPCRPSIDSRGDFDTAGPSELALAGLNLLLPAAALAMYALSAMLRS